MVLRANEKVTRGVGESAKAADRFASCREERMREGGAFPLEWGQEFLVGLLWERGSEVSLLRLAARSVGEGGAFQSWLRDIFLEQRGDF